MAKRRANGEGYLRKRRDDRWELRITVGFHENGKPKYKSFYGRTQKEARDKFKAYESNSAAAINHSCNYNFNEWSDIWFEHHKKKIAHATQNQYRSLLKNHMAPHFGSHKIADITIFDIENFLYALRNQGYKDQTIRTCRAILNMMFNSAAAHDLVRRNPVPYVEHLRATGPKTTKESFTADEVNLLLKKLSTDRIGLGIRLLLCTGMRPQELLALEPDCIEEDGSVIHIRQALGRANGTIYIKAPKSREGFRDVPVPKSLQWCARELRKSATKFIFEMRKKDMPCNPSTFDNKYREALAAIPEVRYLTPHCCRHTYVSQMQALGVDLATLKSIVGHYDEKMTDHYLHVQESIRRKAVSKFDSAFSADHVAPDDPTDGACKILEFPKVV